MRGIGRAVVLFAAAVLAGCKGAPDPGSPNAAQSIVRSLAPAVSEGLVIQSVLLERPIGDTFLDCDLWDSALPVGKPETRVLMAENGIRAGKFTGCLPQRFQDLLDSDSDTVDPHEMTFGMRKEAVIPTAGPVDPCRFDLLGDLAAVRKPIELHNARCGILVKPKPVDGGKVQIWCEPQLQHGERREWYRPTEDGTGFAKFEEVPLERFPSLAFEAILAPGECLVIGSICDRAHSLGSVLFTAEADNRPRQRVLVVRASQSIRSAAEDLPVIAGPYRQRH